MISALVLSKRQCTLISAFQLIGVLFILIVSENSVASDQPKRILKGDMTETYNILPQDASNIGEVFIKGMVYGRLRTHYFRSFWEEEKTTHNPVGFGVGGSLIAKSAPYGGFSATLGGYTSQNLDVLDDEDAVSGATGKDTFSRFDALRKNRWGMTVLAQAYLQYSFMKTDVKIGRQIWESFLAQSNDTKMIPNTFEGVSVTSRYVPYTSVMLAFFNKQKLRDHTRFHDVITYGHKNRPYNTWDNNDDSTVHKGLSYANLKAEGEDVSNDLVIAGISNTSIKDLKLDAWYHGVPDLFYSLMGEANYKIPIGCGWELTPGLRYMQQFDDGAGDVGGAALTGKLAGHKGSYLGYEDADNVDGRLYGARLVLLKGPGLVHLGYTRVSDDADLIAPWRGFPTGGYTRSMGQSNWEADTDSFMVKADFDFGKANLVKGLRASMDWTLMNYDDNKEKSGSISKTDRYFIHADVWYKLPVKQWIEVKARMGFVEADNMTNGQNPSYDEYRAELNYLF
jgi:hypothetical protein